MPGSHIQLLSVTLTALGIGSQFSPIPAGIQLFVCNRVLKMKSTDLRLLWICPADG